MTADLLKQREAAETKYLTGPEETREQDRAAYLNLDRQCREARLLPKTK